MGAALRDRRGASPGASRLQGDLQPDLDHRAARLPDTGPGPLRSARPGADGRISANWCLTTVDRYIYDEGIAIEQVIDFIADTPGVSGNALQACANGSFDDAH